MTAFKKEVVQLLIDTCTMLLGTDPATLSADTRLEEDLHCTSVHLVQMSSALENEYEVEVPFMAIKRCKTFAEVADFVDQALS